MGLTLMEAVALMAAGMMTGNELCVSIVNARLSRLDDQARFAATRTLAAVFGAIMPFWYAATLLLAGVVAFSLRGTGTAAVLADIAALLYLFSIVYTIAFLVPINNRIAAQEWETRPADWKQARQRWDRLHASRVTLLILSLACLALACLLARTGR